MISKPIRILGIAGSLRRESYNRAALRAAANSLPKAQLSKFSSLTVSLFLTRTRIETRPPKS